MSAHCLLILHTLLALGCLAQINLNSPGFQLLIFVLQAALTARQASITLRRG